MAEQYSIQNLLFQVSFIDKKYKKIAEITGENFNIFRILGLEASEVRTHSAFFAELLHPKGSHGLRNAFLKHFIDLIGFKEFDTDFATVEVEKYAGLKNEDETEGGRIDIVIGDHFGQGIIIENKIHAGDQKNQLLRYYHYGLKTFPKGFRLVYLTLHGNRPGTYTTDGRIPLDSGKFKLVPLSYKTDVIKWLENCQKESVNFPMLRESLTQYIILLKDLTGQAMNHEMEREISELLTSSVDNISNVYLLRSMSLKAMEAILLRKLKRQLIEKAISFKEKVAPFQMQVEMDEYFCDEKQEESWLYFLLKSKEPADLEIDFGFGGGRNAFQIVIFQKKVNPEWRERILKSNLDVIIGKCDLDKTYDNRYFYAHHFTNYMANWYAPEIWCKIADDTLSTDLCNIVEKVLEELKRIKVIPSDAF